MKKDKWLAVEVYGFLAGVFFGALFSVLFAHCFGCTPAARAEVVQTVRPIVHGLCQAFEEGSSVDFVRVVCRVLTGGLQNASTRGAAEQVTEEEITIYVPRNQVGLYLDNFGGK